MIILDIMVGVSETEKKEPIKFKDVKVGYVLYLGFAGGIVQVIEKTRDEIRWADMYGVKCNHSYHMNAFNTCSEAYNYKILSTNSKRFIELHNKRVDEWKPSITPEEIVEMYKGSGMMITENKPDKYKLVKMKKLNLSEDTKKVLNILFGVLVLDVGVWNLWGYDTALYTLKWAAFIMSIFYFILVVGNVFNDTKNEMEQDLGKDSTGIQSEKDININLRKK